jgi:hypothetical protein
MQITPQQIINPGVIEYDQKRHEKMTRFKEAVTRARFLGNEEKGHWMTLGYLLTNEQLDEVQKLIINEDLKRLQTKEKLEKIKPVIKKE